MAKAVEERLAKVKGQGAEGKEGEYPMAPDTSGYPDISKLHWDWTQLVTILGEDHQTARDAKAKVDAARAKRDGAKPVDHLVQQANSKLKTMRERLDKLNVKHEQAEKDLEEAKKAAEESKAAVDDLQRAVAQQQTHVAELLQRQAEEVAKVAGGTDPLASVRSKFSANPEAQQAFLVLDGLLAKEAETTTATQQAAPTTGPTETDTEGRDDVMGEAAAGECQSGKRGADKVTGLTHEQVVQLLAEAGEDKHALGEKLSGLYDVSAKRARTKLSEQRS